MKEDFMPYWKDEEKCYEEAKVEGKDERGKKIIMHWPRNKPIQQICYENWSERAFNAETNQFHPKRDKKTGNIIKGTGAKHVVRQIVRVRRRDGREYLYSNGIVTGFDAFGDEIHETCSNPEVWNRTHFKYEKKFNPKTNMLEKRCVGPNGSEIVYEMSFNEENLKELFDKRVDLLPSEERGRVTGVSFCLKDERNNTVREVKDATGIASKTLELFLKDFDYLYNADYLPAALKAELKQQAIEMGLIPSNPQAQGTPQVPPKTGAYSQDMNYYYFRDPELTIIQKAFKAAMSSQVTIYSLPAIISELNKD